MIPAMCPLNMQILTPLCADTQTDTLPAWPPLPDCCHSPFGDGFSLFAGRSSPSSPSASEPDPLSLPSSPPGLPPIMWVSMLFFKQLKTCRATSQSFPLYSAVVESMTSCFPPSSAFGWRQVSLQELAVSFGSQQRAIPLDALLLTAYFPSFFPTDL